MIAPVIVAKKIKLGIEWFWFWGTVSFCHKIKNR